MGLSRSFAAMPTTATLTSPAATHRPPGLFSSATVPARLRYGAGDWVAGPARDRVLTTLLVLDIVRSTQRAVELGDRRWCQVLDEYHLLLDRELARHRGRLVNRSGDGVLATFDAPARALRCAVALGEAAAGIGLQLRAGVHAGECEVRAGDVAGIAVHVAARLEGAARPGEVLASSTVRDLVAGSGLAFEDRGHHPLAGIPGEWPLFAVSDDADRPRTAVVARRGDGEELSDLSKRELDVLALIAEGCTNEDVAARLHLSHRTVERHLSNIYAKLRLSGKAARAAAAVRFSRAPVGASRHSGCAQLGAAAAVRQAA
jgi:class 3 adenylate cyclase/DNA-binding CsgD family transcriptional regulator